MKKLGLMLVLLVGLLAAPAFAAALEVAEGVITTQVVDREPVDAVESYPATVERLYCFTRVTGAEGETRVFHVWFHKGEELARVELPVRSPDWRTWSAKTILPSLSGEWTVEVQDAEGKALKILSFSLL
ncbi:hypothetical protein DESUT3_14640 [Desulfuromonas versatilis]|uniref:DUF2914 domain-containing protein n=1 Tax=Desulfuromonas versatilis TaxID=2802975 RepID=A0ABN6DWE9_9BACT|nr:DUF2914 domain-containing protein [Desulfuromonas versatilis]BCR04395.1 hypothetical protein DESUT3_14640 [Desulfuromonas versatilis]